MKTLQPIATIQLDTPDSASLVRGVVCYAPAESTVYVLDPRSEGQSPMEDANEIYSVDDAIQYAHNSWGYDYDSWALEWLCEESEDYGGHNRRSDTVRGVDVPAKASA